MPEQHEKESQLRDDYRHVFGSDEGKRVLDDLTMRTDLLSFIDGSNTDLPHSTLAFREGKRAIWLYIFGQMHNREEGVTAIQEEHRDLLEMAG